MLDLKGSEATLTPRLSIVMHTGTPDLRWERLETTVSRRSESGFVPTIDIGTAGPIAFDSGARILRVPLALKLDDRAGTYHYQVELRTPANDALAMPPWVADLHSSNPTASSEPNRTFNLEPFVRGLLQATVSVYDRPVVARFFLQIRKR